LAAAAVRRWPVSDEKISFEYKLKRFLDGCLMPPERAHVHWNGTFADEEKRAFMRTPLPDALQDVLAGMRGLPVSRGDDLGPYLWFDQKYFLPDDILIKSDRMSMAHSLEVRPPFLDHRIVEFAATLPPELKINGGRQKVLLKELMRGRLPAAVLTRPKVGFDIPAHEWLRGPLRSLLVETLAEGAGEYAALFRREALENYVRLHIERRANLGYHLWGLMILFMWMKRWRIQATPSSAEAPAVLEKAGTYI
jgi:asparagine synthase (glutamine-hydrolysing)